MEDLKYIIVFLGSSSRRMMENLFINFIQLIVLLALTMVAFYINFKYVRSLEGFIFFVSHLFIFTKWLKDKAWLNRRFELNRALLKFMDNPNKKSDNDKMVSVKNELSELTLNLKKENLNPYSKRWKLAVLGVKTILGDIVLQKPETLRNLKFLGLKFFMIQTGLFILMIIPFGAIALLLTLGVGVTGKVLIFCVGFIFVWFINSAIVSLICDLLIQKKIYDGLSKLIKI